MIARRTLLRAAPAGLAALALARAAGAAAAPITIGAPANMSGGQAALDGRLINGARLRLTEINAAGGVLGRPLALAVRDTRTDPPQAAIAARLLIEQQRVPVLMGYGDSEPVLLAGAVAERAGIPFVTPGATSPLLPGQVGSGLFLACFGDNTQAAAGADYLLDRLAARTAWLLVDEAATYTTLLGRYFRAAYEHRGGRILAASRYRSGDPSLAPQLAQLGAAGARPDAVYLAALPDDAGRLVAALRQGGIDQPIVGGDGFDTPQLTRIGGAAADGVHYSTHVFMSKTGRPEIARFYRAYQAAYRRSPHNAFAALGYDAIGLIADAIGRAGSAEPAAIRAALAATRDFPALTGSITYPPGQRIPDKPVAMVRIERGQPVLAAEIRPSWTPAP